MEIVAIISLIVAVIAVVWAVRQPAKTQRPEEPIIQDQIDGKESSGVLKAWLDAEKLALDGHITSLLEPTKTELTNMQTTIKNLQTAYSEHSGVTTNIGDQVRALTDSTTNLNSSLRSSTDRGQWGEMQLRNVIEHAGLDKYADFKEQVTIDGGLKPDVLINLPDGGAIAVDAKVPGEAYLKIAETEEESKKKELLEKHVKAIQDMVKDLNKKDYPGNLEKSIGFVVMFIPVESMLSDALRHKPELLRESLEKKVLLTTPMNLLALLVAVAKGWQAVVFEENLDQIKERLSLIYGRFIPLISHFNDLGKELGQATVKYNDVLRSIEGSVMVGLDEIKELGLKSNREESHSGLMSVDEAPKELSGEKVREYADQLGIKEKNDEEKDSSTE